MEKVFLIAAERGELHVLRNAGRYSLIGGACEAGESHEHALMRHAFDQCGYEIETEDLVCEISEGDDRLHFYSGSLFEQIEDGKLTLTQIPVSSLTFLAASEQSAVSKCLLMMRADAHGSDGEGL